MIKILEELDLALLDAGVVFVIESYKDLLYSTKYIDRDILECFFDFFEYAKKNFNEIMLEVAKSDVKFYNYIFKY